MSKFKVGDRVTGTVRSQWAYGGEFTVSKVQWDDKEGYLYTLTGGRASLAKFGDEELTLVKEGGDMPYQRRTFKQLKDTPSIRKGALWQQETDAEYAIYRLLDEEFKKSEEAKSYKTIETRTAVEDQPNWFVEVFKVSPEYMTQEELDQFDAFKKAQKPARTASPRKRAPASLKKAQKV